MAGSRDYRRPPEACVEVEPDGVTLTLDLARSDLLVDAELIRFADEQSTGAVARAARLPAPAVPGLARVAGTRPGERPGRRLARALVRAADRRRHPPRDPPPPARGEPARPRVLDGTPAGAPGDVPRPGRWPPAAPRHPLLSRRATGTDRGRRPRRLAALPATRPRTPRPGTDGDFGLLEIAGDAASRPSSPARLSEVGSVATQLDPAGLDSSPHDVRLALPVTSRRSGKASIAPKGPGRRTRGNAPGHDRWRPDPPALIGRAGRGRGSEVRSDPGRRPRLGLPGPFGAK